MIKDIDGFHGEEQKLSLRYLTAGETHGPQLTAIIEGLPSNLSLISKLEFSVARRQKGHGRGRRMQIETDTAQIVGGVRHGRRRVRRWRLSLRTRIGNIGRPS